MFLVLGELTYPFMSDDEAVLAVELSFRRVLNLCNKRDEHRQTPGGSNDE